MRSVEARQVESMEAKAVLQPEKGTSGAVGGCLSLAHSRRLAERRCEAGEMTSMAERVREYSRRPGSAT